MYRQVTTVSTETNRHLNYHDDHFSTHSCVQALGWSAPASSFICRAVWAEYACAAKSLINTINPETSKASLAWTKTAPGQPDSWGRFFELCLNIEAFYQRGFHVFLSRVLAQRLFDHKQGLLSLSGTWGCKGTPDEIWGLSSNSSWNNGFILLELSDVTVKWDQEHR